MINSTHVPWTDVKNSSDWVYGSDYGGWKIRWDRPSDMFKLTDPRGQTLGHFAKMKNAKKVVWLLLHG
jgi:hypothetical protein